MRETPKISDSPAAIKNKLDALARPLSICTNKADSVMKIRSA
jgi:hypothetical protein